MGASFVLNLFPQALIEKLIMLRPIIETNRHQSTSSSSSRSQVNPSSGRQFIGNHASKFREEETIAAQLEGLSERISQLESMRE